MSKVQKTGKHLTAPDYKSPAGNTIANILFKKLIENSHDGLTLLDNDLQVIYRSASAERINGWTASDRAKYDMDELIHPDDRMLVKSVINKVKAKPGNVELCQFRSMRFAGQYIWIECTFTNFLNDPDINAIVCNFMDITERKLYVEKIIESERFTKTVTDNLPAFIAYFDSDLDCLFANKPYMDWFEKQPHEILGVNKRDILDKEEFELHEVHIREVLKGKPQRFERTFHRADGRAIDTDTQYLPDIEDNKIKGFYSLIYDVTEVKYAEREISKKNAQIEDILDNITDGFIALDQNKHYTYANKQVGLILGRDPASLIGKNIWDVFPDAVGSATYEAIETAFNENKNVCNEDHYEPLGLWQENRVYPSAGGISMFIRDITKSKEEEQHLKLLESVITNTTDAVLITEAKPLDEPGPRIMYVNEAFTRMTGYTAAEVIGKTPRILQGPKSDIAELKKLSDCMRNREAREITIINYKKNGDEFWINFAVSPVINAQGVCTHFIAIERDITERKNEELQKAFLSEITQIFNETDELNNALLKVLGRLADFGNFSIAEAWLIGADKKKVNLMARFLKTEAMKTFYDESDDIRSFAKDSSFPDVSVQLPPFIFWHHKDGKKLLRDEAARKAGLKSAYIVPLKHNNEVIGTLLLGSEKEEKAGPIVISLLETLGTYFGADIKRRQVEQELNQIFNFTPDILCIANTDGYFKKVNAAMSTLLEYSEEELLSRPFMEFVHPLDKDNTASELQNIITGHPSYYIENRYITKSGKIKWLAWTTTGASEQGILYCSAKDITDKKDLEVLLHKATDLSRIGGWDIDMMKETVYWSPMTREILEVAPDFEPDLEKGIDFYKEGESRVIIKQVIADAIANGASWDVELEVVTAKRNTKWVRVIGEAEFTENRCTRIIGSFQEIDTRKKAEIASKQALEDRNTILESIDDAFFAVDKNWIVTYWNKTAEKLFSTPKSEILSQNLLEKFPGWVGAEAYQKYCEAIKTGRASRFEHKSIAFDIWLETSVYPAENGLAVYVNNINDRKKAEASAIEALEERNTILESIDDAFFAVDKNWKVTYWNNKAEKVLMTPRVKILNKNLWKVFSESIDSESYKKYHEAVATNQAMHFEDYFQPLNRWYEISAYPSATGLSVYFKDVTDRKFSETLLRELNSNLQKQTKELAISNAELQQFAYVASHDLQEPLRMITSFLTQLERKYTDVIDDKGRQYINFAVDGAKRMRQIILDLLDFSRVGSTEEDLDEVDFNKLMNEILVLYRKQVEEEEASIIFENLPIIKTYKTPIRQVLQNLVGNSLKYHKANLPPIVTISCKETKTHFQLAVKDNGIGIAPEFFDKIFIIFQRLHNREEYSGTGMGLAIAKKIVENLGGKIWLESEEDKGSTFYFTLLKNNKL